MSSPVIGDDGTVLPLRGAAKTAPPRPPPGGGFHAVCGAGNRALLTVPLLCARWRSRLQTERPHQVQRRLTQTLLMQSRPQVDHVALLAAPRVEAVEHPFVEVHAEGPAPAVAAVDWAGAA